MFCSPHILLRHIKTENRCNIVIAHETLKLKRSVDHHGSDVVKQTSYTHMFFRLKKLLIAAKCSTMMIKLNSADSGPKYGTRYTLST